MRVMTRQDNDLIHAALQQEQNTQRLKRYRERRAFYDWHLSVFGYQPRIPLLVTKAHPRRLP